MALSRDALYARANSKHSRKLDLSGDAGDWDEPDEAPRDWKKIVLVIGLGALSWVATYVGMLELIQANMGDLPIAHRIIIGFSVAMLMTMIIWLLDQVFSPVNSGVKFFYILGYLFLTAISVGFGFGFYWKVLESRSESTRSAESAISQVQNALHAGSTRLEQLNTTLVQLNKVSSAKAVEEREKGTSCPNSRPGDGPRRKLRDADAAQFAFAAQFVGGRITSVKSDLSALDGDLKKVGSGDKSTFDAKSGTRNKFLRNLDRRLELTVTGFNTFRSDPQLRQIRADLGQRSEKTIFPNSRGGTFICPDAQLQTALRGVVRAIDQLPELQKPVIAAVEGSEATIEAFRRLSASVQGLLTLDPPPTADELRKMQKKAMQSISQGGGAALSVTPGLSAGLSSRDYVPLAIAVFVDLCLLLVSMGRPMNRLNSLVPKMREAERGPVIRILSRFNEIHRDPEIRQNFEVFRHVVFDYLGDYYVAVPLDTPYNRVGRGYASSYGAADAQELQHEAHLLANLFTSFEQERIFKRVFFLRTKMIRSRLARQGSKFAGSHAFRVYRFRNGSWSDIILGAVMGAARRVEAEKRRVQAIEEQLAVARGPQLGEAGMSSKAPPFVSEDAASGSNRSGSLNVNPEDSVGIDLNGASHIAAQTQMNGSKAKNGAGAGFGLPPGSIHINGNGHSKTGSGSIINGARASFLGKFEKDDLEVDEDDEDWTTTTMTEDQVRSRYGKYAASVLAEMHDVEPGDAANDQTGENEDESEEAEREESVTQTESSRVTGEFATPATPKDGESDKADNSGETEITDKSFTSPKIVVLPSARKAALLTDAGNSHEGHMHENKAEEIQDKDVLEGQVEDPPSQVEATATLIRETAKFSFPVSEAVLPGGLAQALRVARSSHQNSLQLQADGAPAGHIAIEANQNDGPLESKDAPKLIEVLSEALAPQEGRRLGVEDASEMDAGTAERVKND